MRLPLSAVFLAVSLLLTGCAADFGTTGPSTSSVGTISGTAQGGRQPISGAHVFLFETAILGYGGPGLAASSNNASKSLLKSVAGVTTLDSTGTATNGDYYVTTDAGGGFNIGGDYISCDTNHQVYLYAVGGKPDGVNANSAAGLLASLGECGSFGAGTTVNMNEVSTIALAYAAAGFATDATHIGILDSGSAETGLRNAFANANQLYDTTINPHTTSNAPARSTTPDGNGTVPQKQIDTLANIIAACVNTTGPSSSQCSTLFTDLQSTGATAGTKATDTATEAIYMAHNPSVTSVYSITGSAPNPYNPWLDGSSGNGAPADFTVSLVFIGGGIKQPFGVAIDGSGNAWISNGGDGVTELSAVGKALTSSSGYSTGTGNSIAIDAASDTIWIPNGSTGLYKIAVSSGLPSSETALTPFGSLDRPTATSVDGSGNLWFADNRLGSYVGQYILETTSVGASYSGSPFHSGGNNIPTPYGVANDTLGNAWMPDFENNTVNKFNSAGVHQGPADGYTGGNLTAPQGIAVDANNNVWVANWYGSTVTKISNDGSSLTAYYGGGLNEPGYVAIDGGDNVWVLDTYTRGITEFSNTGTALSPRTFSAGIATPTSMAVDGSGNVWATDLGNSIVVEYLGVATPVVTPLAYGVAHSKLGARP